MTGSDALDKTKWFLRFFLSSFPFFFGWLLFFDLAIPIFSYFQLSHMLLLPTCISPPNSSTLSSSFPCPFLFLILFFLFIFPKQNSVFGFSWYDSIPGLQCSAGIVTWLCAELLCLILVRVRVKLHSRMVKKLLFYVYVCSPFIVMLSEQSGLCLHWAWVRPPVYYGLRTDMRAMIILAVLCLCLFSSFWYFLFLFGLCYFSFCLGCACSLARLRAVRWPWLRCDAIW